MSIVASNYDKLKQAYASTNAWGLLSSIDLKNCSKNKIQSKKAIKKYVILLCDLIKMKRYGEPEIVHFGEDEKIAGYSMTQLIETSLISGHFANLSGDAYIDIFSCKIYNPFEAAEFTQTFFEAESYNVNTLLRKAGVTSDKNVVITEKKLKAAI